MLYCITEDMFFSNLFLNSGAHIQHHYLFNSKAYQGNLKNPDWYCPNGYDPLIQILSEYDYQLGKLLKFQPTFVTAMEPLIRDRRTS